MNPQIYNDGTGDGIAAIENRSAQCSLLSIDAWNGPDGWS